MLCFSFAPGSKEALFVLLLLFSWLNLTTLSFSIKQSVRIMAGTKVALVPWRLEKKKRIPTHLTGTLRSAAPLCRLRAFSPLRGIAGEQQKETSCRCHLYLLREALNIKASNAGAAIQEANEMF